MVDVTVRAKLTGKTNWVSFGIKSFAFLPRVGELVGKDIDGQGYGFRVVAFHHPIEPTMTAGDLYISQVGTISEEIKALFERIVSESDLSEGVAKLAALNSQAFRTAVP